MCKDCNYTIHGAQHHFGWNNTIAPAQRVEPGATILFHCQDASAGQFDLSSTVDAVRSLDFGKVNPVSGPIFVEGAEPGDVLMVSIDSFVPSGWGWTANIPGFGFWLISFLTQH
jgi:acetamidase/formamidase